MISPKGTVLLTRIINSFACALSLYMLLDGYVGGLVFLILHAGSLACLRSKFSAGVRKGFIIANAIFVCLCLHMSLMYIFQGHSFFLAENVLMGLVFMLLTVVPMAANVILINVVNVTT